MVRGSADASYEALIREVAGLAATVSSLDQRVSEHRDDAREARDAARAVKATLDAHDLPAQIIKLQNEFKGLVSDLRVDVVNANTRLKSDMQEGLAELDGRVTLLEQARDRQTGALGALSWLGQHAPWLAAVLGSAAAVVGLEKLSGK